MNTYHDEFCTIKEFTVPTSFGMAALWNITEFAYYDFHTAVNFVRSAVKGTTASVILIDAHDRKQRQVLKACGFNPMSKEKRLEAYPYIVNMYCTFDE